ncbi:ANXA6 [Symbiodinium sp. CCMP2456]|nr:ANXA6 [Symbiodinium sp. CCMP2456]
MKFQKLDPKAGVHTFLARYTGRDVKNGDDYWYVAGKRDSGFLAYLEAPCWSTKARYFGSVCPSEKEAEVSAAKKFTSDEQVVLAAKKLPPTMTSLMGLVKKHAQSGKKGRTTTSFAPLKEEAAQRYNSYQDRGFRNSLWDGAA